MKAARQKGLITCKGTPRQLADFFSGNIASHVGVGWFIQSAGKKKKNYQQIIFNLLSYPSEIRDRKMLFSANEN